MTHLFVFLTIILHIWNLHCYLFKDIATQHLWCGSLYDTTLFVILVIPPIYVAHVRTMGRTSLIWFVYDTDCYSANYSSHLELPLRGQYNVYEITPSCWEFR